MEQFLDTKFVFIFGCLSSEGGVSRCDQDKDSRDGILINIA
jgi:hypothetical protein